MSSFLKDPAFVSAMDQIEAIGESASGPYVDGRAMAGLLRQGFSSPISIAAGLKNNLTATTIPTASDDESEGKEYSVGSVWIANNKQAFICTDSTTGAAKWDIVSPRHETVTLVKGGFGSTETFPYPDIPTAVTNAVSGDLILLGSGLFSLDAPLSLPSGVSLQGAGIQNGGTAIIQLTFPSPGPLLICNGNQEVRDLSIAYPIPVGGPSNIVEIDSPNQVTFRNISVSASTASGSGIGFSAGAASGQLILEDCVISGSTTATSGFGVKFDKPGVLELHNVLMIAQTDIKLLHLSAGVIARGARVTTRVLGGGTAATFIECADASCFLDDVTVLDMATVFSLTSATSKVRVSSTYLDSTTATHLSATTAGSVFQYLGGQLDLSKITHDPGSKVLIAGGNIEAGKEGYVTYGSAAIAGDLSEFQVDGAVVLAVDKTGKISYTPATPGDWAATAPANLQDAIDRLAAQVASLGATPVP
jgi:hypothetical protein